MIDIHLVNDFAFSHSLPPSSTEAFYFSYYLFWPKTFSKINVLNEQKKWEELPIYIYINISNINVLRKVDYEPTSTISATKSVSLELQFVFGYCKVF